MKFRIFPTDNPQSNRFDVVNETKKPRFVSSLSGILTKSDLINRLKTIYPHCSVRTVSRSFGLRQIDIGLLANP